MQRLYLLFDAYSISQMKFSVSLTFCNLFGAPKAWGLPCRYMVVLSQGGFYADLDTNCWKPMDSIMRPEDKMLAGWEDEFSTFEAKERFFFGRQRQVRPSSLLPSQNQLPLTEPLGNMELCEQTCRCSMQLQTSILG